MHTSMKTWSFLSNYKGVCSVFLWGCPAALLTLWGLCFSRFLPPHPPPSLPFSPTLFFFSASVHLLIPAPFFRRIGERVSFIYSFAFHLFFPFILFSFLSPFCLFIPPPSSLSPTHPLPQFFALYCSFWIWAAVPCETSRCLLSARCRVSELMTVYFARNYSCTPIHRGKRLMHSVSL